VVLTAREASTPSSTALTLADACDLVYALIVERLERHVLNERQVAVMKAGGAKRVDVPTFDAEKARLDRNCSATGRAARTTPEQAADRRPRLGEVTCRRSAVTPRDVLFYEMPGNSSGGEGAAEAVPQGSADRGEAAAAGGAPVGRVAVPDPRRAEPAHGARHPVPHRRQDRRHHGGGVDPREPHRPPRRPPRPVAHPIPGPDGQPLRDEKGRRIMAVQYFPNASATRSRRAPTAVGFFRDPIEAAPH
jgi:hypothetical protein